MFYNSSGSRYLISCLAFLFFFGQACQETPKETGTNKVEIKKVNGKYDFYINDELFEVKGAGLDVNAGRDFRALAAAGANCFRTWRADAAPQELDSAVKYGLKIAMGIEMGQELHHFDYNDDEAVAKQFERIKEEINKYKNHPSLLCWVVGNELNLLIGEDGSMETVNPKVYDALSEIVDYIHKVDPNHPVTTTFAGGAREDHVKTAYERVPQIDFLSYQVYGELAGLPLQEMANNIDVPYTVTEYGPYGHWERPATSWGREIEENSSQKADGLWDRIQKGFETDTTGRNMGGFAFVWGQKQERTPTWYGIFNKDGKATAVVDELTRYWSGSYPANRAPVVSGMSLDGQTATDNIKLAHGKTFTSQVAASDHEGDELSYKWVLLGEVETRSHGGAFEAEPEAVQLEIVSDEGNKISFKAPTAKGEYRLFCYIYDQEKVGNVNIPFLVE